MQRKRTRQKSIIIAVLAVFWLSAAGAIPAAAAPIREVKIRLTASEFDEEGKPILEADASSEKYEVTDFSEIQPEAEPGREAEPPSDPLYEIELSSNRPDGFAVMGQEKIRLAGIGGICVKAFRKDSGQTLRLTVRPGSTGEVIGEIDRVSFKDGRASWTKAPNASAYLAMLFKDSKRIGTSYRTQAEEYDFSALIQEAGIYHCKVYPLTESGRKGHGCESGWETIRKSDAERIAEMFQERRDGLTPEEPAHAQTEPTHALAESTHALAEPTHAPTEPTQTQTEPYPASGGSRPKSGK